MEPRTQEISNISAVGPILSVEETVLRALRDDIVHLNIAPGTRLPMVEVAERAGVSLTPARQVLRRLEAEGLVVSYPRTGSSVAPLTWADAELVMTVSGALEKRLMAAGVPALTQSDLDLIRHLLHDRQEAAEARDLDQTGRTGLEIREVVYHRANRPALFQEAVTWRYRQRRYVLHAVRNGFDLGTYLGSEFTALAQAYLERDADRAEEVRIRIEERVLETLQNSLAAE